MTATAGRETTDLLAEAVAAVGGIPRDGQQEMARRVAASIAEKEHLLIQAGTGTGKSLAYIVPAMHHAVNSGSTVVISTATLALQNQLVKRDIPSAAQSLRTSLGRLASVKVLKGRSHYICLNKISGGYPEQAQGLFSMEGVSGRTVGAAASAIGDEVVSLRAWAEQTDTGDRDDLDKGVKDAAWRAVSVSARECVGSVCPVREECFVEKARADAREADIVVTNHAMLAIDALGDLSLLPEHDVLIVDESHELADRVVGVATVGIAAGSVSTLMQHVKSAGLGISGCKIATDALLEWLGSAPAGRITGDEPELDAHLAALEAECRRLIGEIGTVKEGDEDATVKTAAKQAVEDMLEVVEKVTSRSEFDVAWCTRGDDDGGAASLWCAPLWASPYLRESFYNDRTVVMTSATLTLGGSFRDVAKRLGLATEDSSDAPAGSPKATTCDVGSPFNYGKQGIMFVASTLPPPGPESSTVAMLEEVASLHAASRGGMLGLFSSRRAAVRAAEHLREVTDLPILAQGEASLPELVKAFAEDPQASLVGTLSLWQGVDVPGLTSRLVVIDKLPFPRPDDPLNSARSDAISKRGGNGFMSVSAFHAASLMAQGVGRLIRRTDDLGVVAILDSRVATKRYGGYILGSLPPLWRAPSREVAVQALERLAKKATQ